jgi:hypothetical protein
VAEDRRARPRPQPGALRAALIDRRFYALGPGEAKRLRLSYTVDGADMGARLVRRPATPSTCARRRPTATSCSSS